MAMWLYQLSEQSWSANNYRLDVWENERWKWPVGKIVGSEENPIPGDSVVFFYARHECADPGFYGWAVVLQWPEDGERRIYFRPVAPSDQLKMRPWWNAEAERIADQVRGSFRQATLWRVPQDLVDSIRDGILDWVNGRFRGDLPPSSSDT